MGSSFLSFSKVDYDHPLFQGIFENKFGVGLNHQIESPQIFKSINLNSGKNANTVISLSNSYPFLIDYGYSKSKILVYSINPSSEWSDYPFKGLFIPLTYKSVFYVSNKFESGSSLLVGDAADVSLKVTDGSQGIMLKSPSGEDEKITMNQTPSGFFYSLTNTNEPGIFSFLKSGEVIKTIPVNLAPEESDPDKMSIPDLDAYMKSISPLVQYKYLNKADNISEFLQEARYGVELWKELLIIALLLMILEMFISKDSKKELIEVITEK